MPAAPPTPSRTPERRIRQREKRCPDLRELPYPYNPIVPLNPFSDIPYDDYVRAVHAPILDKIPRLLADDTAVNYDLAPPRVHCGWLYSYEQIVLDRGADTRLVPPSGLSLIDGCRWTVDRWMEIELGFAPDTVNFVEVFNPVNRRPEPLVSAFTNAHIVDVRRMERRVLRCMMKIFGDGSHPRWYLDANNFFWRRRTEYNSHADLRHFPGGERKTRESGSGWLTNTDADEGVPYIEKRYRLDGTRWDFERRPF